MATVCDVSVCEVVEPAVSVLASAEAESAEDVDVVPPALVEAALPVVDDDELPVPVVVVAVSVEFVADEPPEPAEFELPVVGDALEPEVVSAPAPDEPPEPAEFEPPAVADTLEPAASEPAVDEPLDPAEFEPPVVVETLEPEVESEPAAGVVAVPAGVDPVAVDDCACS